MHNDGTTVMSFETGVKWIHELTDFAVAANEIMKRSMTVNDYVHSIKGKNWLYFLQMTRCLFSQKY